MDYDPVCFLRCHSKNRDSADVQTQVWNCAFQPSTSNIVATCGGNSVCIIDCSTQTVISKFYTKIDHLLFTLSWGMTYIKRRPSDIIACGGTKGTIYLLDPTGHKCLLVHSLKLNKKISISALLFHPREKNILYCGTSDGDIRCLEVTAHDKHGVSLKEIQQFSTGSEIFDLSFCHETRCLLASCNDGLFLFHYLEESSTKSKTEPKRMKLELPHNPKNNNHRDETKLVDSIEVLKDGYFACKCALHGNIYICDLKNIVNRLSKHLNSSKQNIKPVTTLEWSPTDNYFMYMGVSPDKTLLSCGDDKGALWLYNLKCLGNKEEHIEESRISWPSLADSFNDKKRKLSLHTYDIVVDKVAISDSGSYLVAVTNNNLVCIWKNK